MFRHSFRIRVSGLVFVRIVRHSFLLRIVAVPGVKAFPCAKGCKSVDMETNWMQSGLFADNVSGERRVRIRFYGSASG